MSAGALAGGAQRALAPAKINLGLFLGPVRASDGRHELVTVMQSISLADELTLEAAPPDAEGDQVLCPGVAGENLAARALRLFRERTGWSAPPLRVSIVKRIPVAAGLGGGSADAAATLRLAQRASGLGNASSPREVQLLRELAAELGADVPAQVSPGRWLATGAGEQLHQLPAPAAPFGVLVLALDATLSTAAVYAQADALGLARPADELARLRGSLEDAYASGAPLPADAGAGGLPAADAVTGPGPPLPLGPQLLHNDLQAAAVSLCPQIEQALTEVRATGA
ncbi:MAG TPA: hypothetical protein VED41_04425, partial [Solirubrobacteraceae bacterium]|nr:hypothetical protein [Solirubrobacteraceae bacterium]